LITLQKGKGYPSGHIHIARTR